MTAAGALRGDEDPEIWFREHFSDAADEILRFLGERDPLEGRVVADIGCGDGIIDLGLALRGRPRELIGFDLRETDVDALLRAASAAGVADELPDCLRFARSGPGEIPAESGTVDVVVTWSAFEHVSRPINMLLEIKRVLKPEGIFFLQLWPFYYSEHGGHLWPHYEEPFPHLMHTGEEIRDHLRGRRGTDPGRDAVDEFESLNRITVEQLHQALLAVGLVVTKLELIAGAVHIPPQLAHVPLGHIGVTGIKLLAVPR